MSKMKNKIKSIESYFLKNKKASILAYSLIVISVMIVIVTSISVVSVIEKKGAVSTDASVQAYQTADSGVQIAIKKINKVITENAAGSTSIGSVFTDCGDYKFQDAGAGEYRLSFFDNEEGTGPSLGCGAKIEDIQNIKSVGEYKDTVRAVQVAVAATSAIKGTCEEFIREGATDKGCHFEWGNATCASNDCGCSSGTKKSIMTGYDNLLNGEISGLPAGGYHTTFYACM